MKDSPDNIIKFPNKIDSLNRLRIYLALQSIEDPLDEALATMRIILGLHNFFSSLEETEEIVKQLGYLEFLIVDFYESI